MDELYYTVGPEGDALREKVLPLWAQDPTRPTDVLLSGPDIELDETTPRRFFGEEQLREHRQIPHERCSDAVRGSL